MNTNIEEKYESLDYSNRSVVDALIKNLMEMQSKSELDFQKIKPVDMIKLPSEYPNINFVVNKIVNYNDVPSLMGYRNKIIDTIQNINKQIDQTHNQNLESIKSNHELKKKICELFSFIGIRDEYTELQHKGTKQKSVQVKAGYLTDLNVFCKIDDGYKSIVQTINSNIQTIEHECAKALTIINNREDISKKTDLFYAVNKIALGHSIKIIDIADFIEVKRLLLNDIDQSLGLLYKAKIEVAINDDNEYYSSYSDADAHVAYSIMQNNMTLINEESRDILSYEYSSYTYIKDKLLGVV